MTTNSTTEPRQRPVQTIVFTFNKPIKPATTVIGGIVTGCTPTICGNEVVGGRSGVDSQQYVTGSLTNDASTNGGTGDTGSVRIGLLVGDVNTLGW